MYRVIGFERTPESLGWSELPVALVRDIDHAMLRGDQWLISRADAAVLVVDLDATRHIHAMRSVGWTPLGLADRMELVARREQIHAAANAAGGE